ncbi:Hypothetical predicted protein [Xyrichtys novacula]|uniref:Uncharacterized protein n=1 Tax=Xyrichtys novacula TaxID=13765 RepID=A0AAV1GHH1_XYRNO|nr:Hypothetical predicted protein [Xyrichtys novacula]
MRNNPPSWVCAKRLDLSDSRPRNTQMHEYIFIFQRPISTPLVSFKLFLPLYFFYFYLSFSPFSLLHLLLSRSFLPFCHFLHLLLYHSFFPSLQPLFFSSLQPFTGGVWRKE